jgi:hypothetical protein
LVGVCTAPVHGALLLVRLQRPRFFCSVGPMPRIQRAHVGSMPSFTFLWRFGAPLLS